VALVALALVACEDDVPTSIDSDLFPVTPTTVELVLPWAEFADSLRVLGGYGAPTELGHGILATEFEGSLSARTLARFPSFPDTAFVLVDGTNVRSALEYDGGRLVARFDTLASTNEGPVTVIARAIRAPWHPPTTTWTAAIDTINDARAWPEPGGGPADSVGGGVWNPEEGDTLVLELDSLTVASWNDSTDVTRGVRLDVVDPDVRLQVNSVLLRLNAIPAVRPDTVVDQNVIAQALTFIYDPVPDPPPNGIRIGGVPAWRTFLALDVPAVLEGPAQVCERVECPFTLEPDKINAASLILRSRASEPAFQPTDTVRLDVRPVLAPDRLPKAPLGVSFVGVPGRAVAPEAFGEEAGQEIAVPITSFVRDLVRGETVTGDEPPSTLALLSFFEPLSIAFATFAGPGEEGEPFLRLIVTLTDTVQVR
jgi:hypothetical protein